MKTVWAKHAQPPYPWHVSDGEEHKVVHKQKTMRVSASSVCIALPLFSAGIDGFLAYQGTTAGIAASAPV